MEEATPIWRNRIFASIFLEPYLDEADGGSPVLPPVGEAIDFVYNLLQQVQESYPHDDAVQAAAELCSEARRLHPTDFDSLASQPFLDFLSAFVQRVQRMKLGDTLLTPGFWNAGTGSLFVIGRPTRGSEYTLAICSTGEGSRYHPTHPSLLDGKLQRAVTLSLHGLAPERLTDSSFWFGLFHCLVSARGHSPATAWALLYERLLPYAAQRPLSDFFPQPSPVSDLDEPATSASSPASPSSPYAAALSHGRSVAHWRVLPASGHHRSLLCVIEGLHAALAMGTTRKLADADRVEALLTCQMLRLVQDGLKAAFDRRLVLPRSERLFVRGAASQLINSLGTALQSKERAIDLAVGELASMVAVGSQVWRCLG